MRNDEELLPLVVVVVVFGELDKTRDCINASVTAFNVRECE